MISAERRGVLAMMHVAIKKTRARLIAFRPAKDVFIRRMPPPLHLRGLSYHSQARTIRTPSLVLLVAVHLHSPEGQSLGAMVALWLSASAGVSAGLKRNRTLTGFETVEGHYGGILLPR
jgi:hypothetical protein